MIHRQVRSFLYNVNLTELSKHFKEYAQPGESGKYYQYVSKNFYGAVIRSQISLASLDRELVVVSVRLKGRSSEKQTVTGIKIDFMELNDTRLESYNLDPDDLETVDIRLTTNIPGNIILNPDPSAAGAYFYKRSDGFSMINFVVLKD